MQTVFEANAQAWLAAEREVREETFSINLIDFTARAHPRRGQPKDARSAKNTRMGLLPSCCTFCSST